MRHVGSDQNQIAVREWFHRIAQEPESGSAADPDQFHRIMIMQIPVEAVFHESGKGKGMFPRSREGDMGGRFNGFLAKCVRYRLHRFSGHGDGLDETIPAGWLPGQLTKSGHTNSPLRACPEIVTGVRFCNAAHCEVAKTWSGHWHGHGAAVIRGGNTGRRHG